jgi:hypothetical protein
MRAEIQEAWTPGAIAKNFPTRMLNLKPKQVPGGIEYTITDNRCTNIGTVTDASVRLRQDSYQTTTTRNVQDSGIRKPKS